MRLGLRGAASPMGKDLDEFGGSKVGWVRKGRMTEAAKVTMLKIRRANVPRRVPRSHTFSTSSAARFGLASKIGST